MASVFIRTAKSSATTSYLLASVSILVGSIFVAAGIFADSVPMLGAIGFSVVGLLAYCWGLSLFRSARSYLKSGRDWRVEITNIGLSWQSADENVMASFHVAFKEIELLRHFRIRRGGKSQGYRDSYTIELNSGESIELSSNIPGIRPALVFEALEEEGLPIEREHYLTKNEVRQYQRSRLEKKRAGLNKQRT